jgi:ribosomal protein S18 acetylase RimI-like enzyme
MNLETFDAFHSLTTLQMEAVVDFLYKHLGKYGDEKSAIRKALEYSSNDKPGHGGIVILAKEDDIIIGAVVVNKTGMEEYIPENILVYIATHGDYRGQGIGKKIMTECISKCHGNIALHVEADNPAIRLYERLGFTNPYLEMRLIKETK